VTTSPRPPLAVLLLRSTDEPERAVAALSAARAATTLGATAQRPALVLDDEGVRIAAKGVAEAISGGGRPDAKEILTAFVSAGGRVLASRDAWRGRGYLDDALVEGATLVGAEILAELAAAGYAIASF
jgi:uncharacterized protein